jgi:integrase
VKEEPALTGSEQSNQVEQNAVRRVLEPIWTRTPETASRLRARIEAVLAAAQVAGHIDADKPNPARWKGWLDHMLPNPRKLGERGHHPALPYADVPAFMASLSEPSNGPTPGAARALMFTILTAARSGEVLNMTWDEVSFDTAVWTIPASRMKMGKEHAVPLSDSALAILRAQEAGRGNNPFVFPGRPQRPLSAMAMSMLLRRMKVDATVHGMRSSFRMWAADVAHAPFEVAEQCLAHVTGKVRSPHRWRKRQPVPELGLDPDRLSPTKPWRSGNENRPDFAVRRCPKSETLMPFG